MFVCLVFFFVCLDMVVFNGVIFLYILLWNIFGVRVVVGKDCLFFVSELNEVYVLVVLLFVE